jgi:alanine racemase
MRENSVIEINLTAVAHNVRLLRRIIGPACALCPIVKADAYGLGATRIAKTLLSSGADMLAVYTPGQAAELIHGAVTAPVLVLMPVREVERVDELYRGFICGRLHLTVHDAAHLDHLIALAERFGAAVPVHLEVDTGMTRGGCSLEDAPVLIRRIAAHRRLNLAGLFTHFACAESDAELTDLQLEQFNRLIEENAEHIPHTCIIHAASSFATLRAQRYHKSMVRIGLAWAGYGMDELVSGESGGEVIADGQHLQPCLRWRSRIVQLRTVPAGTRVGYGQAWTARRTSLIGVVPVGYADGFPYGAGMRDDAGTRGKQAASAVQVGVELRTAAGALVRHVPVVGAVNMDQITIDLTDLTQGDGASSIGIETPVELVSPDPDAPNHLPRLAEAAGSFTHEMMCRLNPRLKRVYHLGGLPGERSEQPQPIRAVAATG